MSRTALSLAIVCLVGLQPPARADEPPEPGTSHRDIVTHMQQIRAQYGDDAVLLESGLLSHTVQTGSLTEAGVSIEGIQARGERHFLTFQLQSGIVFNDRDTNATDRVVHAWGIVEKSLRQFRALTVPADGLAVVLNYHHTTYADEGAMRARLAHEKGEAEAAAFYLLGTDVGEFLSDHISNQQLVDRSSVLVNGTLARVVVPAPPPTALPQPQ